MHSCLHKTEISINLLYHTHTGMTKIKILYCWTLKMKAQRFFRSVGNIYQSARCKMQEHLNLQHDRHENVINLEGTNSRSSRLFACHEALIIIGLTEKAGVRDRIHKVSLSKCSPFCLLRFMLILPFRVTSRKVHRHLVKNFCFTTNEIS